MQHTHMPDPDEFDHVDDFIAEEDDDDLDAVDDTDEDSCERSGGCMPDPEEYDGF